MRTEQASWLGVLGWSLNFGPEQKSREIQWRVFMSGETKLLHNKVHLIFWLGFCSLGGFFGVPTKQDNYGGLPRTVMMSFQGCDGMELLDWLFDQNDGILRHEEPGRQGNHHTLLVQDSNTNDATSTQQMLQPAEQADDDFLNALLSGSDSVSGSPVWSPSQSDSGISEDPPSDQMDSPQRPESPPGDTPFFASRPQTKADLEANFSIDLNGWGPGFPNGQDEDHTVSCRCSQATAELRLPADCQGSATVWHTEPVPNTSQQSIQELILNEDEKKLLVKEGVTLPGQLPLTKYEERILKKIRRKIRNKQSAQESRKKKKEMAACNAHNHELQRKVSQLQKCNMSLMEQLRRLQALVMNTSNKPAQTGTCVLVLLLSFSLILFPNLKPFSDTKVSQEDFSPVRIQSRSLQNLQASRVLHITESPFSAEDNRSLCTGIFPGKGDWKILPP
ncbi:hypothetical protein F7725_027516 [Dissostichus mawsoni]|uniref:BZIP domain-containing protein n=1 Tax=Dissostichus mawsoni TaxID=36200 RepID=A0A7J5XF90_DISMA|nr:hypothetical protein F7725_027516 [Dissostichus mawsoni]